MHTGRRGAILLLLAVAVLAGCSEPVAPGQSATPTPEPETSLPATTITPDEAARLAARALPADAVLRSVVARTSMTIVVPDGASPGVIPADGYVWAVTFDRTVVICPPPGPSGANPCWSPRPGVSVVILDYLTGAFIQSDTTASRP